jgi:hypothetical protein
VTNEVSTLQIDRSWADEESFHRLKDDGVGPRISTLVEKNYRYMTVGRARRHGSFHLLKDDRGG